MRNPRLRTLLRPLGRLFTGACAVVGLAACGDAPAAPARPADPATAEIVTADIDRFWRAVDAGGTADAFQREYLGPATPGLRDFVARRTVTATSLAAMVRTYPRYFESIRANMTALGADAALATRIRGDYQRLRELYPPAVFPPVTLLVGRFSTGGTTSANGLLIGAEFYVRDATTPVGELGPFQRANARSAEALPYIVAHEAIHAQQAAARTLPGTGATLLEQAMMEGVADFVSALASGGFTAYELHAWALPREQEIWTQFKTEMYGQDMSRWLYNQDRATSEWPGDLGYFVGYRIAKAFYDRHPDPKAAVRELITARDAAGLLTRSGYDPARAGR